METIAVVSKKEHEAGISHGSDLRKPITSVPYSYVLYKNIYPLTLPSREWNKLIIGMKICNLLVTSCTKINLDDKVSVGSHGHFTTSHIWDPHTTIFIIFEHHREQNNFIEFFFISFGKPLFLKNAMLR
ncbi:hypothetical protein BDA99DRAFT_531088 [Phascolomyces articulosus]|uniref:Uncharacterized protein n=1 Tax=Phascolomyces articulosus TaxID=60185 RepID=A0AAD5PJM5_9FUNG|nr:hypothetical protein BDA99DRAFT_531088 [Phascolomyces articulosus]